MTQEITTLDEVLAFWFSEPTRKRWFRPTPEFDSELKKRFLATYRAAATGNLDYWDDTAEGALALVICLDQFPRNLFRQQPESFTTDKKALSIAARAIDAGLDQSLIEERRHFLYMPFMHSEDPVDQNRCIELFEQAGLDLTYPKHHRKIIERFGRFPHRNAILGRKHTDEETAYLNSERAFKGM